MECPHCGSRRVRKDDPPVQGYALGGLGLLLVGLMRLLHPSLLTLAGESERQRLLYVGAAMLAYGIYRLLRHDNRFCAACGFRFRDVSRIPAASGLAGQADAEEEGGRFRVAASASRAVREEKKPLSSNTPLEPILACLRFKDPKMRAEAAQSLRKLTGQEFGEDAAAWDAWWAENKAAYKAGHRGGGEKQ